MKGLRKHIANWLSNLSVASIVVGAFQSVELLPELNPYTKWVVVGFGGVMFIISCFLAKEH